jgi:hypothetical protein
MPEFPLGLASHRALQAEPQERESEIRRRAQCIIAACLAADAAAAPHAGLCISRAEYRSLVGRKLGQQMRPVALHNAANFRVDLCDVIEAGFNLLPDHFQFFGLQQLAEAELTDGQGRALSAHKSQQGYEGYAKRTLKRALAATRKRHAHTLANATRTNIQNEPQNHIQNADPEKGKKVVN